MLPRGEVESAWLWVCGRERAVGAVGWSFCQHSNLVASTVPPFWNPDVASNWGAPPQVGILILRFFDGGKTVRTFIYWVALKFSSHGQH